MDLSHYRHGGMEYTVLMSRRCVGPFSFLSYTSVFGIQITTSDLPANFEISVMSWFLTFYHDVNSY